ncbi:hypothetical protein EJB05_36364 [Eragrostis curvula]|uniref:DUF6598 domain-containing protein n=1 Tax=Eragrostis curvula TaxID=38414 RepID=A0A5J9U9D6_9POAL|nr:hypothetical protein EJB05_36364 [Eragrostis curvula]
MEMDGGGTGSGNVKPPLPEPEPEDNDDGGLSVEDDDDGGSSAGDSDDGSSVDDDDGGDDSSWEDDDDDGSSWEEDDDYDADVALLGPKLARLLARCMEPPTEEEKVLQALRVVREWQFTEYDPKSCGAVPTRFCNFNTALFDFEKESMAGIGPPFRTLTSSEALSLEDTINPVSVKILESDVGYPISIFGTILARDQVDYKCVYLFRRARDDPQVITSLDDMLTLTGPYRGLAATSHLTIEINLKIKCEDGNKDFSKGLIEHRSCNSAHAKDIVTRLLTSWMSTVQLVYTYVPSALEATVAINILNGPCDFFTGKVVAWTSGNDNHIILHDSQAAGMRTVIGEGGSVALSRCMVVVPVTEELVLKIWVQGGDDEVACFEFTLSQTQDYDFICEQGFCELQVKVAWTSMVSTRRHNVFESVGRCWLVV